MNRTLRLLCQRVIDYLTLDGEIHDFGGGIYCRSGGYLMSAVDLINIISALDSVGIRVRRVDADDSPIWRIESVDPIK